MTDVATNPFDDVRPWSEVRIGGQLLRVALVEIDGVSTKDEWTKNKSKETSGSIVVFKGTTWGDPKLTFEAVDREDFEDLRRIWELLKPTKNGFGSTPAGATTAPTSKKQWGGATVPPGGSPDAPSSSAAASGQSGGDFKIPNNDAAKTQSVGPRPPTVSIQNEILAWHGITAIARQEWEGPKPTDTNSWRVVLTVVADKPPIPAGGGAMAPAKAGGGQQFTAAATDENGQKAENTPTVPAAPQKAINTNAGAGASGT